MPIDLEINSTKFNGAYSSVGVNRISTYNCNPKPAWLAVDMMELLSKHKNCAEHYNTPPAVLKISSVMPV